MYVYIQLCVCRHVSFSLWAAGQSNQQGSEHNTGWSTGGKCYCVNMWAEAASPHTWKHSSGSNKGTNLSSKLWRTDTVRRWKKKVSGGRKFWWLQVRNFFIWKVLRNQGKALRNPRSPCLNLTAGWDGTERVGIACVSPECVACSCSPHAVRLGRSRAQWVFPTWCPLPSSHSGP